MEVVEENNVPIDGIGEGTNIPTKKTFLLESDDLKKVIQEEKSYHTLRSSKKNSTDRGLIETRKRRSISFAAKARMRSDSQSGEIELNHSFAPKINNRSASNNNDGTQCEISPDMHMTVGLSIISKEDDVLNSSSKSKKLFHSTPLKKQKCGNVSKKSVEQTLSVCPVTNPSEKDDKSSDPLENIKLDNISRTRRSFRISNSNCLSKTSINHDNKMIQVSKSVFGSSNEGTSFTVSKKKSGDFSTSYSYQDGIKESVQNKTKNGLSFSSSKKFGDENQIVGSKTFNSESLSKFDTSSSIHENRNSVKRMALKSFTASQYSTTENISNSSNSDYFNIIRNKKSVGFRDAVSLIEKSSNGFIDSISGRKSSTLSNDDLKTLNSVSEMESNSSVMISPEKNNASVSGIPQGTETSVVDKIDHNNISKECSLFRKLIQSAVENKQIVNNKRIKRVTHLKPLKCNLKRKTYNGFQSYKMKKWVSHNLVKFLNDKLMNEQLDHFIKTEKIISILCSVESAVRNLSNSTDIESTILPLKNVLSNYEVCTNLVEYSTFIMRFTPFEFQRKVLPLGGYFGSLNLISRRILSDPVLTQIEKDECCYINELNH